MKKSTLLLFALFTTLFQMNAQITIGVGNLQGENAPFETYSGYSFAQTVDLANSQDMIIYMTETTRTISYFNDSTNLDSAPPTTATNINDTIPNVILGGITQACPTPSDIVVMGVTANEAVISWTENGTSGVWNIEIVESGTTPTGTPTDIGVTNPYTATGLTAATDYDFYLQADCGTEQSAFAGPITFQTLCDVIPLATFDPQFEYAVCPNATAPINIGIVPTNFTEADVTVDWFLDGIQITGASGLTLDTVLLEGDYAAEISFNASGCVNTITTFVMELDNCVIPKGISPGVSPGINDNFDLSNFDVTKLEIFNRNGTLVYSKKNYTNEWVGQSNDGKELPVGTYFYTMEYEGGTQVRSAWIYINR